jgi:hypothetical protein
MSAHLSCSSISAISRKSSTALMSNSRACITRGDGGAVTPVTFARWRATSAASSPTASSPRANAKIDTPFSLRSADAAASARGNDTPRPSEMITNTGTTLTLSPGHSGSRLARQAVLETSPNTRLPTRDNPRCRFVSPPGWVVFRARKTVSSAPPVSRTRGRSRRAPGKNPPRRGDSWREEKVAIANRLPFAMRGTTLLLTALPTSSTAAAHCADVTDDEPSRRNATSSTQSHVVLQGSVVVVVVVTLVAVPVVAVAVVAVTVEVADVLEVCVVVSVDVNVVVGVVVAVVVHSARHASVVLSANADTTLCIVVARSVQSTSYV